MDFTNDNGGRWQKNKCFAFGVFSGNDKGRSCERLLQSLERKKERSQSLYQTSLQHWQFPVIPPVHRRSLSSHHSAPFVRPEGNPAAAETKRPRQSRFDATQEPWAQTPGWAAPPGPGLHLSGPGLRSGRLISRCTETRPPLSLEQRPRRGLSGAKG